ncbi:MAG: hypothetical protein HZB59_03640 [Ignavibacteriales bacterium]|nr:hypothetical protein [Ignavibacteriales bacterium]
MPYKKSICRADFEVSQNKLISSARKISLKRLNIEPSIQTQVFQSSIFLLCAMIEQYILEIHEQILFKVSNQNISFSNFPAKTRTLALLSKQMGHFRKYFHQNDERELAKQLEITQQLYSVLDNNQIYNNQFNHELIVHHNKYPSIKNLKIVFFRFGIDNIISEMNKRGKKDYELLIKSFLDVRESIAHELPPSLTHIDVRRHFHNISDSIDKIDRILFTHVKKYFGPNCWPT